MLLVTLVKPPERSRMNFGTFSLAVLAAAVRDIASVKILDATDLPLEEATKAVIEGEPDVVGITAMGLKSVDPVCNFVEAIRKAGFREHVIAGGHGASMLPKAILEKGADAVVYGEGELTFREVLLSGISDKVQGLFLLRSGRLLKTSPRPLIDLDSLNTPARDLTEPPEGGVYLLETSRGCPHSCTFCETSRFYGGMWRARSPENVAKDVRDLVNNGATIIHIADDNFTASPDRVLRICELLKDDPLPLFFLFSARSDDLIRNAELIPALGRANFLRAAIGVETVVPDIARRIGKSISFEQHKKAFAAMQDAGIFTIASFIVGLPGETEEMRRGYVDAAVELADSATFLPFQPLPGTPMESGNGEPEPWCVEYAARLTREFERHPVVLRRLLVTARDLKVRGMLARASLHRRLEEKILDERTASAVMKVLRDIQRLQRRKC